MDNDIPSDTHFDIMGNDVARNVQCDITLRNDLTMCTYHGITMLNDLLCISTPNYDIAVS